MKIKEPMPLDKAPLLLQIADVLKELVTIWKQFYEEQKMAQFTELKKKMDEIDDIRGEIASPLCSEYKFNELKDKILGMIDESNKQLRLDFMVRKSNGEISDFKNTPIIDLFHDHRGGLDLVMEKRLGIKQKSGEVENAFLDQQIFHIMLDVRSVICAVDGDNDCYFSLYSNLHGKFVTEEFAVRYMASGLTHGFESQQMNELKCVFRDISEKHIESELYLVCRLVRYAHLGKKIDKKKGKAKDIPVYRRPFGCAILLITENILKSQAGKEHRMIIYHNPNQEMAFPTLHESIITNAGNYEQVPKSIGIDVTIGAVSTAKNATIEDPGVSIINKLSFGDFIPPNEDRNDLYAIVSHGEFKQDGKTAARNVLVSLEVRQKDASVVDDCIRLGIGNEKPSSSYDSFVYYHKNDPRWEERVLVRLAPEMFSNCHVFFQFRHCSTSDGKKIEEKPFAFAFKKIVEADETILKDGPHVLSTYKPNPKETKDPSYYLETAAGKQLLLRNKESFTFESSFVSTKLTQNLSLLALLKWKTYPSDLGNILNKFTYIEQNEIMKFLREIFDALFSILAEKIEMSQLVYNAIVFIIGILVDDKTAKFTKFRPILDLYIKQSFNSEAAHRMLPLVLKQYLQKQDEISSATQIRSSMKAMEFLFKFMIASFLLLKKNRPSAPVAPFKREMRELLSLINDLMARTSPEWVIGAKVIALKSVSMFDELGKVFDRKELSGIACRFVDNVSRTEKSLVNIEKLNLMFALVNGPLFEAEDSRRILIPTILSHIKEHMKGSNTEVLSCTMIMLQAVSVIEKKTEKPQKAMLELLSLIDICFDFLLREPEELVDKPEAVQDVVTVFLTVFHHYPPRAIAMVIKKHSNQVEFVDKIMKVIVRVITDNPFKRDWRAMLFFSYIVVLKLLRLVGGFLKGHFHQKIFIDFFENVVEMIKLNTLKIEKFTEQKREYILANYGDLRLQCCTLMRSVWSDHGERQHLLLNDFVPLFLELLKVGNEEIQDCGIDLFFTLVEKEYETTGDFKKVQNGAIDSLNVISDIKGGASGAGDVDADALAGVDAAGGLEGGMVDQVSDQWGDLNFSSFKELFVEKLNKKFASHKELKDSGEGFLSDLNKVVYLMNELESYPETSEYEYERTNAILQLMDYLKKTERMQSYIHFTHELKELHLKLVNFVEAGYAVLLHVGMLIWRDMPIKRYRNYVAETEERLKEALLKEAIGYFDKGKDWEKAIELVQELKEIYKEKWYNYEKLSSIIMQESSFYKNIIENERFYAEYFRCGFYGGGFDENTRNKIFICKSNELEKFIEFQARILARYLDVEILQSNKPPEKDVLEGEKMYIQIVNCKPVPSNEFLNEPPELEDDEIPARVANYSKNMAVKHFVFSRPFHKGQKTNNEFETLWTSRMFYKVNDEFPTFHRRSTVVETREIEVTPFENALISMATKNKELRALIKKYRDPTTRGDVSSFSMAISGVIDAQVNGGPDMYRQAFLKDPFFDEEPEKVSELQFRLKEQVNITKEGLKLHSQIVSEEMRPFHQQLEERFKVTMEQYKNRTDSEEGVEGGEEQQPTDEAVSDISDIADLVDEEESEEAAQAPTEGGDAT